MKGQAMSLNERDESDLISLATNLGNAEAHNRAQALLGNDPEAAEFFRQIRALREALEIQPDVGCPPLPEAEANVLAAAILKRSKQRHSLRNKFMQHPLRWGSMAAAIVLMILGGLAYLHHDRMVVAFASYAPVSTHLTIRGAEEKRFDVPVKAGEMIEGTEGYTVLNLRNHGRVAMQGKARLAVQRGEQEFDLETGCIYVQSTTPARVQAGAADIRIEEPNSKTIIEVTPSGGRCLVQAGRVKLVVGNKVTVLAAGQMGIWDLPAKDVQVRPLDPRGTGWVKEAFMETMKDA
jgi:hypothetical protein